MSVPDTTVCPICYCIIHMENMIRHTSYHQESGDIEVSTPSWNEDLDDPFMDDFQTTFDL